MSYQGGGGEPSCSQRSSQAPSSASQRDGGPSQGDVWRIRYKGLQELFTFIRVGKGQYDAECLNCGMLQCRKKPSLAG